MSFLTVLSLIGALSPLLTLAWLWQLKEWRMDRLQEELQREGWMILWGKLRPLIVALYIVLFFVVRTDKFFPILLLITTLGTLATLTVVQIVLGRQRYPVFTKKAVMVTVTAGLVTILIAVALEYLQWAIFFPFIVLVQPFTLFVSWLLWKPIDALFKDQILTNARKMRERHPRLNVIGVTGSVGKTTTKELLACVLNDLHPFVTPAHVNTELGVAAWMMKVLKNPPPLPRGEGGWGGEGSERKGPRVLIIEMGAYAKREIATMCLCAQPTMGVITYVGLQHVALFGSQENLVDAKAELVEALPARGRLFLNGDNALARDMADRSSAPVTIVSTGGHSDIEAFDIGETSRGIRFRALETQFDVPLPGTHNVSNVLLSIAVGEAMGIPVPRIAELLRDFTPLSKTFQIREEAGVRILDDTHNGSLASMKAAIAWARSQPEQHKIFLTAGLIEMGEYQAPAERELGVSASQIFERTVVVNPLSMRNFAAGGSTVELLSATTQRVAPGSLLVCSGRMSSSIMKRLLPNRGEV